MVGEDQIAELVPCGPSVEGIVQGVKQFADAGFDQVALVQIGQTQAEFCDFYRRELAPALGTL